MKALTFASSSNRSETRFDFILGLQLQIGLFVSMAGIGVIDGGAGGSDASSGSRQLIWGGMAVLTIGYLVANSLAEGKRIFSYGSWWMATILAYVSASISWSVDPGVTVKRSVLLAILVLVCSVSVGQRKQDWRDDTFSRLLFTPMALLLAMSVLATLFMPRTAFTDIGWRGIASHKNEAGQMMAFATVLLLYGRCHAKLGSKTRTVLISLTLTALLLTKSTTALLGLVFGIGLTQAVTLRSTLCRLGSWRVPVYIVAMIVFCGLFFGFQLNLLPSGQEIYTKLLNALGKSETFTGRTAIWELVLGESRFHNPWFGGGYGAFWVGRESISGYVLTGGGVLYPGQSHNGYIDVYNDLGYVGLVIILLTIISWFIDVLKILHLGHPEGRLHLAIIFMCVFLNFGESTLLRGTGLLSIVFIASFIRTKAIVASSFKERRESRSRQAENLQ